MKKKGTGERGQGKGERNLIRPGAGDQISSNKNLHTVISAKGKGVAVVCADKEDRIPDDGKILCASRDCVDGGVPLRLVKNPRRVWNIGGRIWGGWNIVVLTPVSCCDFASREGSVVAHNYEKEWEG